MAARSVIILEQISAAPPVYTYLLRADVPLARQSLYARPGYKSLFQPIAPDTDPDAAALIAGSVVEKIETLTVLPGTTIPQIEAELVSRQTTYQAAVTSATTWVRYGTFFNGSTWTPQGV